MIFRGQAVGGGGGHVDPGGGQGRGRCPQLRGVCAHAHLRLTSKQVIMRIILIFFSCIFTRRICWIYAGIKI